MGNFNLKNITLGIGIGLVFSSIININIINRELTVEEIKKEAVKHNLIVLTNDEVLNNQTPAAPTITQAPTTTPIPASTAIIPSPTPTLPATGKTTVNVKSGMSSEGIADLLKESGVIKDTKAFLKRLEEAGKDEKLKVGSFDIPKGAGYDDIIRILTQ
ncbi:MAG: hypothetical protein ACYCYE_05155 [Clostridia bacterium]